MKKFKKLSYFLAFMVVAASVGALTTLTHTFVSSETLTAANLNTQLGILATGINNLESGTSIPASGVTLTNWTLGSSTATTQTAGDNSTKVATTAYVATAVTNKTIASGTIALGTGSISSATCATAVTSSATGVATTDAIIVSPNADITGVTGYTAATTGGLMVYVYPTTNTINARVCNPTSSSITPGAVTLNYRVIR
jgi:hypothetical protein